MPRVDRPPRTRPRRRPGLDDVQLLRVDRPVVEFAGFVAAVRQGGLRIGWLSWSPAARPDDLETPQELEVAATIGALRAVAVRDGRTVTIKPRRGEAVLRDVLREHFRGCRAVLVEGAIDAPRLAPSGDGRWTVETEAGRISYTTDSLIAALRSPRQLAIDRDPIDLEEPTPDE
ncbi:MAG: hypothetical protein AAGN46_09440 [Acidobacteriota bacterium]